MSEKGGDMSLQDVAEYTVYLGLVLLLLMAIGVLIGNVEELLRQLIDNLVMGVAHLLVG